VSGMFYVFSMLLRELVNVDYDRYLTIENNLKFHYIHTTHALSPKGQQRHLRHSSETPTFYQNQLAIRNTADVTGGNPIPVLLQSISGVSAINPLVAFYDIHRGKREVLFFSFVPDTTRDTSSIRIENTYTVVVIREMSLNDPSV
jgi:hypothetical protein